jgi:hypothetical protein
LILEKAGEIQRRAFATELVVRGSTATAKIG